MFCRHYLITNFTAKTVSVVSADPFAILPLNKFNARRRLHRAMWVSTELMITFPTPVIKSITVVPLSSEDTAGRFRVWLYLVDRVPVLVVVMKVK